MSFCAHCGNQLPEGAVVCMGCGCSVAGYQPARPELVRQLSEKVKINGVIWMVIAVLQLICGMLFNWTLLIVGVLNVITAVQDLSYSKTVLTDSCGIVKRFEPLVGPIITLVYNLIFGGLIGVVGSIYYLIAIRGFVMDNKVAFERLAAGNNFGGISR